MASGSGKNQDNIQNKEPVDGLREESNPNVAAAAEPPLPSERLQEQVHWQPEAGGWNPSGATTAEPPSERLQEPAHGSPEAGGRNLSAATAAEAVAAEKETVDPSHQGSAGSKAPIPPGAASVSRVSESGSSGGRPPLPPRPMTHAEVLASGMSVRAKWRRMKERHIDLKEIYDELMLECETIREMDQKTEAEEMARQQKDQVTSPIISSEKINKKPLWRKFLDRTGNPSRNYTTMVPHVNYEKIAMVEIIKHYKLLEMVAGRGVEFDSNALNLHRDYSEFRPVHGDGECFYRSFIFSYLEQVLDRQDKHEEHRLLVAVKAVARQHTRLGWASEFSRSHKAFKKLIKKVMRWKTHSRWKHVPTTKSYRKEKLLDFFSSYVRTNDIFAFLRLVAAIWICSHSEEFEPRVHDLNEGYTLTDWCFHEVIERRVFTDHVQIVALLRALGVPLRVEYLFRETGQDLYTGQDSQDDMPRRTCWPRSRHLLPPDHEVPRVTLLYTCLHYDIIYPHRSDVLRASIDEYSSLSSLATKIPSQH